jgi:hypothetical protein
MNFRPECPNTDSGSYITFGDSVPNELKHELSLLRKEVQ